ncbi:unnamed protein product [Pedinophyceae sp. YPF-701]|nr:unnamed protein product [Pedinophyceae sp. YPF-701]
MSLPVDDLFGYTGTPKPKALRREVLKWIQGLDLTHSVRDPRRDLANGFLVAEICTRYFPLDLKIASFSNGLSGPTKDNNWGQLQKFFARRGTPLPDGLVDATINREFGAANLLMEHLYEILTTKKLPEVVEDDDPALRSQSDIGIDKPKGIPATEVFAFKENKKAQTVAGAATTAQRAAQAAQQAAQQAAENAKARTRVQPMNRRARRGQQEPAPVPTTALNPIGQKIAGTETVEFGEIRLAPLDNIMELRSAFDKE